MIDCHPLTGLQDPTGQDPNGASGLIITMHGEFEDQEPGTTKTDRRSFSRTIILGPGLPQRNPIRVISDMLTLKAYNPLPPPAAPSEAEVQQQQMIIELSKQTGMTAEYSKLCLEGVNWNFQQAFVVFNEKRVSYRRTAALCHRIWTNDRNTRVNYPQRPLPRRRLCRVRGTATLWVGRKEWSRMICIGEAFRVFKACIVVL